MGGGTGASVNLHTDGLAAHTMQKKINIFLLSFVFLHTFHTVIGDRSAQKCARSRCKQQLLE